MSGKIIGLPFPVDGRCEPSRDTTILTGGKEVEGISCERKERASWSYVSTAAFAQLDG